MSRNRLETKRRRTAMRRAVVDDKLWNLIEPLLPRVSGRAHYPGCKRIDDRKVLSGIVFVLTTGIAAWQQLPPELGFGSGMTCWRRLRESRSCRTSNNLRHTFTRSV